MQLTGIPALCRCTRAELETVTREQPDEAGPFLTLGVLQMELRQPAQAEAALLRYLALAQAANAANGAAAPPAGAASGAAGRAAAVPPLGSEDDDTDENGASRPERGLYQAWLSLAQLAEQRGDYKAAEAWLAKVDDPARALDVQGRRAIILARQGQVAQAREMVRRVPERSTEDARSKFMAEAGVLREVKQWKEAFDVLAAANQRFPDDADLLYEQAMMAEKTSRLDEMEKLLRRVIEHPPRQPACTQCAGLLAGRPPPAPARGPRPDRPGTGTVPGRPLHHRQPGLGRVQAWATATSRR